VTRIVHVATRFYASGSERSIADIVAALPGPSWEHVLIVGRDHDPASIRALCGEIEWHVAPDLIRSPHPIHDPLALRELVGRLGELRPDIVHTIQSKSGILGRTAARRRHAPLVVHSVVMANFGPGFHPVAGAAYRTAERVASRWTDAYFVNGLELRDRFVRAGVARAARFTLVRSSVEASAFRAAAAGGREPSRNALDLPPDAPIALFAGSLDGRKGAHELAPFLAALLARVPEARLVVAGDGPLRADVERAMAARGLTDAVRFLGFTARLPEVLAASDCLVMLSRAEGLATVLLFAAAAGRSFVSYEVDGPGELIALGAGGRVVPMGDWLEAADATAIALGGPDPTPIALDEWRPEEVRRRYRERFEALRMEALS